MLSRGKVFLILIICVVVPSLSKQYEGSKLYEVNVKNSQQLKILHNLAVNEESNYDFFKRPKLHQNTRILVKEAGLKSFTEILSKNSFNFEIINENFQKTIEQEINTQNLLKKLKPFIPGQRLSTERYYTQDEINEYIEDLGRRYPKRAYVKTVGKSYEGRLLKTITITNGDGKKDKNVILMDGGFHAREWISPATAIYVIGELVENFNEYIDLLKDYDWIILPVVNADGYDYTHQSSENRMWRKTRQPSLMNGEQVQCYGTDPNRNFDFHWNEDGASPDPCSNTYAGPKAFSEPETIVIRDLIHSLSSRGIMYLTLHSYGFLILYPWGWSAELPDTWEDLHEVGMAGADAIREATGTEYKVGSSTVVLYVAAGASDDYAFNAGFPISFTMELPGGGSNGFDPPPSSIDSYVKETWIGIRAMAKKLIEKYSI